MQPDIIRAREAQTDHASHSLIIPSARHLFWTFGLLSALLAGCQAAGLTPLPTRPLPTPIIQIEHQGSPTPEGSASPEPSATSTLRPVTLQEIAAQAYGERLIQQVTIPAIGVDSPVVPVGWRVDPASGSPEWDSPGPAVGWVLSSALPDQPGNIILYGHNNMYGSVFKNLAKLNPGDSLSLQTGQRTWSYQVDQVLLLPFATASQEQRSSYQAYLAETTTPRLTVLSCWPPESNTYRVVVVAYPVSMP